MSQLTDELVKRLNEISQKLDVVSEGFSGFIEAVNKLGENFEKVSNELVDKLNNYTNIISERSKEDFDESRGQLVSINKAIEKIRRGVGTEQLIRISESLNGLLELLGGAEFNPDDLKNKIFEISKYIESTKT